MMEETAIEKQLAAFRQKKKQEEKFKRVYQFLIRGLDPLYFVLNYFLTLIEPLTQFGAHQTQHDTYDEHSDETESIADIENCDEKAVQFTWLDLSILLTKFVLWCVAWKLFIIWGFGAVYFIFSAFIFIWMNLGTRRKGYLSAYSVFNPNCEEIEGTVNSKQLEQQMLLGGL